jgi:hypothetical protein
MRISAATIVWMVALFLVSSACGGGISLGSNDAPSAADGGRPAGSVGQTTGQTPGPSADASAERPVVDAGLRPSRPDAGPSSDDASTSADAADLGLFATLSDCGYTQVDPHNCGSCGHDCAGGACQAGVCVPLPPGVLASGLIAPTSVAIDANNVYWLSEGVQLVQVMKCAKTGCNNRPTVLASGFWDGSTGKDTLHGLTVDATNVYWATEQGLFACAIDGCNSSPTLLISNSNLPAVPPPSVISVSGGLVYDVSSSGVLGCATNGCIGDGGGPDASNVLWSGQATGVLVDSTTAYWSSNGSLLSCALGGCNGAPTLLEEVPTQLQLQVGAPGTQPTSGPEAIGQIAQDDNYLYYTLGAPAAWLTGNGPGYTGAPGEGVLGSCSKKGIASGGTTLGVSLLVNPLGVATDGTNVYFTDLGNGMLVPATNIGRVAKCPVTGCDCSDAGCPYGTTIAGGLQSPRGIAVDETNVYWSDFGSGTLDSNASLLLSVDGRIVTSPK